MIKKIWTFFAIRVSRDLRSHGRPLRALRYAPLGSKSLRRLLGNAGVTSESLVTLLERAKVDRYSLQEVLMRAEMSIAIGSTLEEQLRSLARDSAIRREIRERRKVAAEHVMQHPELRQVFRPFIEEQGFTPSEKDQIVLILFEIMPDNQSRSALFHPILKVLNETPGAELKARYLTQIAESIVRREVEEYIDTTEFKIVPSRGEEMERRSLREEVEKITSDEFLRLEWDARNNDISRIYTILGPPPLRTLSGAPYDR